MKVYGWGFGDDTEPGAPAAIVAGALPYARER
jgi:hypothetical protein